MNVIKIMIVDNDSARCDALSAALSLQDDLQVVTTVADSVNAVKKLNLVPDVMVLQAAVLNGRMLSRFLRSVDKESPGTRTILAHDVLPDDDALIEEIRQGVRGYLRPGEPPALVARAVRAVAAGRIWAERRILEKTISASLLLPDTLNVHVPDLQPLTCRERDMLKMVLKGASNREIAEMSNISERTVKTHLYRVYRKLKVKSRAKAIALLAHS